MPETPHTEICPQPNQSLTAHPGETEVLQKSHKTTKQPKNPRKEQNSTLLDKPLNRIDKGKLLDLYFKKGVPQAEIAKLMNVSPQAINQQIQLFKGILSSDDTIQSYRDRYPDILSSVELRLMQELVDSKRLKKATTGNIAYSLNHITMHRRLESNLSTENLDLHTQIRASDSRIEELKRLLTGANE